MHAENINSLAAALREASYAHPNQRLGQIIVNAPTFILSIDPFYVSDDDFIAALRKYARAV